MTYSLTNRSGVNVELGTVLTETSSKSSTLTPMPLFGYDSWQTMVFDFGGTVRTITLTGVYNTDAATIKTYVTALNALLDGNQNAFGGNPRAYCLLNSNYSATANPGLSGISVKVESVQIEKDEGQPRFLKYTIRMTECDTTG